MSSSTTQRPPSPDALPYRAPTAALLAVLIAAALLFTLQGWSVIAFPYPVDYGEGPLLDQAVRLARLDNIYERDLTVPPFTVANYPPLYALAQTPWVALFGPAFWYGRLLSWLAALAAAACIHSILRTLTGARAPAAIGALAFLAMPFVSYWAPLFRVDMPALATSLGGLLCVVRWPERRTARIAAALLLTAAIFTRQTYLLAAPLTAFLWLARRSRRRAAALAGTVGGLSAALFLGLEILTGGGFSFHVVTANVNEFRLDRLGRFAAELGRMMPVFLAAGAAFLLLGRTRGHDAWRLIGPYLLAAGAGALTIGKSGSNVNYLLELCAALALATGALVARAAAAPALRALVALALLIQTSLLLGGTRYHEHLRWKLDQRGRLAELSAVVRAADGPVLADEELGLLPLHARPVELQPFEMTQLARDGLWDEAPLLRSLERGRFETILMYRVPWSPLHRTRWSPGMLERIDHHYVAVAEIGPTIIYRPRPPGAAPESPGPARTRAGLDR